MNNETNLEQIRGADVEVESNRNFWANLKWQALFCLLELHGDKPLSELGKIAKLSNAETLIAIESMELIGLVKKSDSKYVQNKNYYRRTVEFNAPPEEVISDFVLFNDQAINMLMGRAEAGRNLTKSLIYNSNQTLIKELFAGFEALISEFRKKSDKAPETWDGVYVVSGAFIDATGKV